MIFQNMSIKLKSARMSVLSIANNPEIQRLFAERNRGELRDRLLPAFDSINEAAENLRNFIENIAVELNRWLIEVKK